MFSNSWKHGLDDLESIAKNNFSSTFFARWHDSSTTWAIYRLKYLRKLKIHLRFSSAIQYGCFALSDQKWTKNKMYCNFLSWSQKPRIFASFHRFSPILRLRQFVPIIDLKLHAKFQKDPRFSKCWFQPDNLKSRNGIIVRFFCWSQSLFCTFWPKIIKINRYTVLYFLIFSPKTSLIFWPFM